MSVGAFYDPRLLYDYGGPLYRHKHAKLVQRDVQDMDSALIAPWDAYSALLPGTLVLMKVKFYCLRPEDLGSNRKVCVFVFDDVYKLIMLVQLCQIYALSIKVLADSDSEVEPRIWAELPVPVDETEGGGSVSDDDALVDFNPFKRGRQEDDIVIV